MLFKEMLQKDEKNIYRYIYNYSTVKGKPTKSLWVCLWVSENGYFFVFKTFQYMRTHELKYVKNCWIFFILFLFALWILLKFVLFRVFFAHFKSLFDENTCKKLIKIERTFFLFWFEHSPQLSPSELIWMKLNNRQILFS